MPTDISNFHNLINDAVPLISWPLSFLNSTLDLSQFNELQLHMRANIHLDLFNIQHFKSGYYLHFQTIFEKSTSASEFFFSTCLSLILFSFDYLFTHFSKAHPILLKSLLSYKRRKNSLYLLKFILLSLQISAPHLL